MEDLTALVAQFVDLAQNGKALGAVGVLLVIVKIATDFTKTKLGQKLLAKVSAQHKWARPAIAAGLGFLFGALGALSLQRPWIQVLWAGIAGLGAGLTSVGLHEGMAIASAKERERRAALSAVEAALTTGDSAKLNELKATIDAVAALPDKKERLRAMASWANGHKPGEGRP